MEKWESEREMIRQIGQTLTTGDLGKGFLVLFLHLFCVFEMTSE